MPSKTVSVPDCQVEVCGKGVAARVNAPGAHLPLGRFFFLHWRECEICSYWQDQDLQHRLTAAEDVRLTFGRGFEEQQKKSSATIPSATTLEQRSERCLSCQYKARMGLGAHRPILVDFQVEQKLVGVVLLPKTPKRWPLQIVIGRWANSPSKTNSPFFLVTRSSFSYG